MSRATAALSALLTQFDTAADHADVDALEELASATVERAADVHDFLTEYHGPGLPDPDDADKALASFADLVTKELQPDFDLVNAAIDALRAAIVILKDIDADLAPGCELQERAATAVSRLRLRIDER